MSGRETRVALGKSLRLSTFIAIEDRKSLIVELDQGLMQGPTRGNLDLEPVLASLSADADAVVLSPGNAGRSASRFMGRAAPALIVRADWTNAFRDQSSVLPASDVRHAMVCSTEDAVALGASAVAAYFFVGYGDDEDEARNMESIALLARQCDRLGMPLVVESVPIGERTAGANFADCVDLAARMAMEAGADAVAAPYTGDEKTFHALAESVGVPLFLLYSTAPIVEPFGEVRSSLDAGASGVIVGRSLLEVENSSETLKKLRHIVHKQRLER